MADLLENVLIWAKNVQHNISQALSGMTPEKYIRLVAIIGAYILIRPYIVKLGARLQTKEHEKEVDPDEMAIPAAISPNALRGQVKAVEDGDEDEQKTPATGPDWGRNARKRHKQIEKAKEERRREEQEDDEDKDIQEFLTDN